MQHKVEIAGRAALACSLLLAAVWIVPPMLHTSRHLCPVRPDGISEAGALPAFARKYSMSCSQCHVAFPILNAYGRQFKMNGYVREKGSEEGVTKTQDGELWIEKMVPWALIVRSRPFDNGKGSVSNAGANVGGSDGSNGFKMQPVNDVDMFIAGGDAARSISWFGELDANVTNFTPNSGDLQFGYHPFTTLNFILARRGFYAMDPYQTILGNESPTIANRALDGGASDQNSLSGNTIGALTQTAMVYGQAVREGLGAVYYAAGASGGNGDNMGRNATNANLRLAFDNLDGLMIGGFGTFGRELPASIPVNGGAANSPAPAPQTRVRFAKTGVDALAELGDFVARGAFLYSYDSAPIADGDPLAITGMSEMRDRAAYAELMYVYKRGGADYPFLLPLIRENWYTTYNNTRQFNYLTFHLAHYFRPNLKAFVEYSVDTKRDLQGLPPGRLALRGNRTSAQIEVGF